MNCENHNFLKTAVSIGLFGSSLKNEPNLTTVGVAIGLMFPEETLKRTDSVWKTLFQQDDKNSSNNSQTKLLIPVAGAAAVAFLGLPVSYPIITLAVAARVAALGFRCDHFFELNYPEKKTGTP